MLNPFKFIQAYLQGAAVTLAEMREYKRAAALLEKLSEVCYILLLILLPLQTSADYKYLMLGLLLIDLL